MSGVTRGGGGLYLAVIPSCEQYVFDVYCLFFLMRDPHSSARGLKRYSKFWICKWDFFSKRQFL